MNIKGLVVTGFAISLLQVAPAFAESKVLKVDPEKSSVHWVGSKVTGKHDGHVRIKEGSVELQDGKIAGGEFEIDMSSIENQDLKESPEYKTKLENHLKSEDFFNVEKFPESKFKITKVEDKRTGDSGEVVLTGDLTVKGITLPVTIPATVSLKDGQYHAAGEVTIDRSKWDIRFNSSKFFDPKKLGDKLIYDDIGIKVEVVTTAS